MIAFVKGRVAEVTLSSAVIDVGGLGYELLCTPNTLAGLREGQVAQLEAALVIREDAHTLFGFATADEKEIWQQLQMAGGVGPKLAQAMLAVLSPDTIRTAINEGEPAVLTQVPGIGQRSAERIIVELKDRVGPSTGDGGATAAEPWRAQVREGLLGLGYNAKDAERALEAVAGQAAGAADVGALLRAALQSLARG